VKVNFADIGTASSRHGTRPFTVEGPGSGRAPSWGGIDRGGRRMPGRWAELDLVRGTNGATTEGRHDSHAAEELA